MLVELAQRQVDRAGKMRRGVVVLGQYLDHLRAPVDQLLQLFQPDPGCHDGLTVLQAQSDAESVWVMALVSFRQAEAGADVTAESSTQRTGCKSGCSALARTVGLATDRRL